MLENDILKLAKYRNQKSKSQILVGNADWLMTKYEADSYEIFHR
jgi:hypothetical protein